MSYEFDLSILVNRVTFMDIAKSEGGTNFEFCLKCVKFERDTRWNCVSLELWRQVVAADKNWGLQCRAQRLAETM